MAMVKTKLPWEYSVEENWIKARIKYNYYLKGRIGWQGLKADEFIDDGPYLVTGTDFKNGRVNWETCYHISNERYEEAPEIHVQQGDLLVTKDGTIGKTAYIDEKPKKVSLNSHLLLMRPLNNLYSNRFLFWIINSPIFEKYYTYSQTGTIMASLSQEKISNFVYYMPTREEQDKIADYLDDRCSKIDKIIAEATASIEEYKELKQAVIFEAVTKGLDKTVPMKDSGVEWIGNIPNNWYVLGFTKAISSIVDYRGKTPEKVDTGVFLVTAKNIKDGVIDYTVSKEYVRTEKYNEIMHRGIPEIGDVLFTTEAPLGKVANVDRIDIALAQRIIKFRSDEAILDNYFLKYWIISKGFQENLSTFATGSIATGIKASKLGMLKVIIPPLNEQKKIVNYLNLQCNNIDSVIVEKQALIEDLQAYKKSLIYEVVTGKRRVV